MAYIEAQNGELIDLNTGNVIRQRILTDGREAVEMHYAAGGVIELFSSAPPDENDSEQSRDQANQQCTEYRNALKSSLDLIEIPRG